MSMMLRKTLYRMVSFSNNNCEKWWLVTFCEYQNLFNLKVGLDCKQVDEITSSFTQVLTSLRSGAYVLYKFSLLLVFVIRF
jgi:hypothetical protein